MGRKRLPSGFTLVDALVVLVLGSFLILAAYRGLTAHVSIQFENVRSQRVDRDLVQAINQIRNDLYSIDPNWRANGILPISYQPGRGPGGSDQFSLLVPDSSRKTLYQLSGDYPPPGGAVRFPILCISGQIYDCELHIKTVSQDQVLRADDRILMMGPGQFVSRIISLGFPQGFTAFIPSAKYLPSKLKGASAKIGIVSQFPLISETTAPDSGMSFVSMGRQLRPFKADTTLIQVVHSVAYGLEEIGGKRYLVRIFDTHKELLAPMQMLKFAIEMAPGTDPSTPPPGWKADEGFVLEVGSANLVNANWANAKSIQADMTAPTSNGGTRNFSTKVALDGRPASILYTEGSTDIRVTKNLTDLAPDQPAAIGQPAYVFNGDGTSNLLVPAIQFNEHYSDSVGQLMIVNGETGMTERAITLEVGGAPFLPTTVVEYKDQPPGAIIGGMYQDPVTSMFKPTLAFLPRDGGKFSVSKKSAPVRVTTFDSPTSSTNGSTTIETKVFDTLSVAVIGKDVFFGSYSKNPGGDLLVYATRVNSDGTFDPNLNEVLKITDALPNVVLSSLGVLDGIQFQEGPASVTKKYLLVCQSNSAYSNGMPVLDGLIRAAEYVKNPAVVTGAPDTIVLGSLKTIARHPYECHGLQGGPKGDLYVGGRLTVHVLHHTDVAQALLSNNLVAPKALWLHEGRDAFQVSNVATDSPSPSAVISRLQGAAVLPDSGNQALFAFTGEDWTVNKSGNPIRMAVLLQSTLAGYPDQYAATIATDARLNSSKVMVSRVSSAELPGSAPGQTAFFPPGYFVYPTDCTSPGCYQYLTDTVGARPKNPVDTFELVAKGYFGITPGVAPTPTDPPPAPSPNVTPQWPPVVPPPTPTPTPVPSGGGGNPPCCAGGGTIGHGSGHP